MAWYYSTYSCGHEGRVNIIGLGKDREWKKERVFSGLCPECYKKWLEEERQKANIEADKKSSEMEFPKLTGTEKQVVWANTLRMAVFEKYQKLFEQKMSFIEKENPDNKEELVEKLATVSQAVDYALIVHTDAKFWIDNRSNNKIVADFIEEYRKYKEENDIPEDVKQEEIEIRESLTVVPKTEKLKSGIVEIEYKDNILYARYIKDDDFIRIVKKLGYKWEGVWCKKITEYTGTVENRAAELGNILLANGFTVQFPNAESKGKAISSEFKPENDRWILYNTESGKLSIFWDGRNNTLYENAKKLPGAKWSSDSMKVKVEFYKEVEDFAETMGFSISKKAKSKIEEYKKKESGFESASVSEKAKENISDKERIEKSLKSDGTIIKDLIDA